MEFRTPEDKQHQKAKKANPKKRKANPLRKVRVGVRELKSQPKQQKFFFIPLEVSNKTKWKLRFFPLSTVKALEELEKIKSNSVFTFQETIESKRELEVSVTKIIDLRWKFRKLLLRWKYNKCRAANDVDPFTLDSIEEPIRIYNIPLKIYYQFEAKSLGEYWRLSLKENDGLIPTPKWPRNPLTNLPIYKHTLQVICKKLFTKGYTDSYLCSLAETRFNMMVWKSIYQIPLRLNAVKNTFQNMQSRDCIDYTYDYIELQHNVHQIHFSKPFYDWIFFKQKNQTVQEKATCITGQWIQHCKEFHEKDILNPEPSELTKELAKMFPIIKILLRNTHTLYKSFKEYTIDRNAQISQSQSQE